MTSLRPCILLAFALAFGCAAFVSADTVETKNGSRIVGKIDKIDAGSVVVSTDYAGNITIKQAEVVSIVTDAPVAVRLVSGTRIDGRVSTGPGGALQVATADGTITTTIPSVAASWAAGLIDPAVDRHWTYEASVDISGKTGNTEQMGSAADFRAALKTLKDLLQFYAGYNRQISEGVKAADQLKLGVDYSNNFSGRYSWYARDEGGFDRVKDVELYNVAAVGAGFDLIKEPKRTMTGRLGLSFRYEGYKNPATPDVKSAGLDVGLNNDMEFGNSKLVTRIAWVPTFEDFGNYRLTHESFYQIPLANPAWKLRLGVSNDYNSTPPAGVKKLDTAYFTRLVLNWQ
jgi:hypothetical protein